MKGLDLTMRDPVHVTGYRVIYGDTDAAGVVYNANYLRLFEIGRTEMMRSLGLPYSRIEEKDLLLPVTESYIRFKRPARYDDFLHIGTSLAEIGRFACRFHYRVIRREEDREIVLVRGFTRHACVSRKGRLVPLPDTLQTVLAPLVSGKDDSPGALEKGG